jgi:signal transduction histidine kinase
MPDLYHAPALALTALLLPAFGYLYHRYRDARTLLWFLGFLFSLFSMLHFYGMDWWRLPGDAHPWLDAAAETSIQIGSALFLASLSPLRFRVGRFQVLYVVPYILPLVVYSILLFGVFGHVEPKGAIDFIFPALGLISLCTALFWGSKRSVMPPWLGVSASALLGTVAFWVFFTLGAARALSAVECANLLMAALLVVFAFRRFSPGVVLTVAGFFTWSLFILQFFPAVTGHPYLLLYLTRFFVMGRVVAALGMILLALEDELYKNQIAQEREHRARQELEAYTRLMLARRRVEDFDNQASDICEVVVAHSRFSQAALLLQGNGRFRLAGSAGLDAATEKALDELATRVSASDFLAPGSAVPAIEQSQTLSVDLTPWLLPGDDLKRLRFTSVLAVPMMHRSSVEGALLLGAMWPSLTSPGKLASESLRPDDLLPIELLVARMQATRSQTMMFERLIDSEKFSHLGQLAANVTQQLNNPLTVVLGYATLLEESTGIGVQDRRAVEAILAESRYMRNTLESLARISRPYGDQPAAVSVSELLSDMSELHRPEFLSRSIEFRLNIAPSLPRVLCSAQQLRQAVRHCLQFAMNAVENPSPVVEEPKTIRVEAASEGNLVQILVGHSGPSFPNPDRAFDPFASTEAEGELASLGLSLCATILRDNNGRALAVNLEPQGAAIILELRAA